LRRGHLRLGCYGGTEEEPPAKDKEKLVEDLREAVEEAVGFLKERGIEPQKIFGGFDRLKPQRCPKLSGRERGVQEKITSSVVKHYKAVLLIQQQESSES